ncbi:bifunctional 3-(3-hydroxy-phenyl)propionate/3-hydroxycinnamic acid hydroxylase [Herbaspirillum sp. NPDC087042]|uniref:bifunctional 3-(3-hydroxy-phenyl)propionate/3-hydroxycinnamic acid hydroxylase MhpA n=1 Tax=Herbaspirillum sp. NPDC087042 TaxID=3364004 RepID=UPI0037FCDB51
MKKTDFDVAIVGLGPTGSVLAHLLGMRGISVLVLEKEPTFYGNARAVYTDDECMRIFQSMHVADQLGEDMQRDTMVQLVLANGRKLMQYWSPDRSNGWPVSNFLYQPALETKLAELLSRYPHVKVMRAREVTDFDQDELGVSVTHKESSGVAMDGSDHLRTGNEGQEDLQTIRVSYLVGADGGRSTVREKLGIGMAGKKFPQPWLVVDLEVKEGTNALRHQPYFQFVCDPHCPTVNCTQPYPYHRFEFMMMRGQTKTEMEDDETIRRLISRYVDPDSFDIRRKLVYTFNALVAHEWRKGRVLLAGDAAHMTPQFIGQGMSAGIRDAANLAWKLAAVLQGNAGEQLLESYRSERSPHVRSMIRLAVMIKDAVSISNPVLGFLRNLSLYVGTRMPGFSRYMRQGGPKPKPRYKRGSYLGLDRGWRRAGAGTLVPQPLVRNFDGKEFRLDDVIGNGFSIIALNGNPYAQISSESIEFLDRNTTTYVSLYPLGGRPQGQLVNEHVGDVLELEDINGLMIQWFRRSGFVGKAVAIVRPDRFAFAVVRPDEIEMAVNALRKQMLGEGGRLRGTQGAHDSQYHGRRQP